MKFQTLIFTLTASFLAITPLHRAVAAEPPKPLKVLIVCGGCCHDYNTQKELLSKGMMERAHVDVEVVHQGGTATNSRIPLYEKKDWSKGFDVVIHDECFSDVKDNAYTQNIITPHREGLPAVVLHCAMHCYRDGTDDWFQFCGVTSRRHGAHYPHEVLNVDSSHPIMAKFGPAWANPAGELYWIEKLWPTAHPLGTAKNKEQGNDEVCVWTNQYGKGRVFGTTLGHHNETVSAPEYLDMVTRGTLWACDRLNDEYLKKPQPKTVRVNIAKGLKATASSEQRGENHFAEHAVDGNLGTRWCANGDSAPQQLILELPQPTKLTGCKIDWESSTGLYRYTVDVSVDGKKWQIAVDASKNDKPANVAHDFSFEAVQAVRITFLGANPGQWGSISEVALYGDKTEVIAAAPSGLSLEKEREILKDIKVPEGFEAKLYAAPPAVNYPTFVASAPNGDVYVSVDKNGSLDRAPKRGAIMKLRDLDGDGRADQSQYFVPDVDSPRGLVWDRDRLYVLHPPHLSAFVDRNGDGVAEEQQILVKDIAFGFKDRPADHTSNGVTLGIDGWLYLAIGDFGFMQAEGVDGRQLQFRSGGVVRVRPDGTGLEVYSRGTRNILEVGLDPLLNGFTRDNTNDGGGWDIRLHHFSGGEHHGYPSLYMNFNDEAVQPLADYGGGSGCGGLYLAEPGFPLGFSNAFYSCDWGREWIYRHKLTPNGATFTADQTEFMRVPRVTDMDVDANGQLIVASWKGASFTYVGEEVGYLISVLPRGHQPTALPNLAEADSAALLALLKSDSHRRRMAAQRELLGRGLDASTIAALTVIANDAQIALEPRVAALFALSLGAVNWSKKTLVNLIADPLLGEFALRALGDEADEHFPQAAFVQALTHAAPRVRRAAIVGLWHEGSPAAIMALMKSTVDADSIVAHTARRAVIETQRSVTVLEFLNAEPSSSPAYAAVLACAGQIHEPEVVDYMVSQLSTAKEPAVRQSLLTALCRLYFKEGTWKGDSWGTRPDTTGPYYQREAWEQSPKIAVVLKDALSKATSAEAASLTKAMDRHRIPLDDALEQLVALAAKDKTLLPVLASQLARAKTVPEAAASLLFSATMESQAPPEFLIDAMTVFAKINSPQAANALVHAQGVLDSSDANRQFLRRGREILFSANCFVDHWLGVAQHAGITGAPHTEWALAVLLVTAVKSETPAEVRAAISQWIEPQWANARAISMLHAVAKSGRAEYANQVLAARFSTDLNVKAAAESAIKELKLGDEGKSGPKVSTLKVEEAITRAVTEKGDIELGAVLFERMNCVKCHTTRKDQPPRGPFLGTIANTYKRKDLAEAILIPSKTLAQGFVTHVFALEDGTTVTGFVVTEAADKVTIRNADGVEREIPTKSIDERTKQNISLMPDGIVKELTIRELSSLMDYLESLPKQQ
ncbi:MAG: heme-binding protein [Planctomycetota bacterium]|nr:MAG: heme-binding protein [Planctomycetota bacterium]